MDVDKGVEYFWVFVALEMQKALRISPEKRRFPQLAVLSACRTGDLIGQMEEAGEGSLTAGQLAVILKTPHDGDLSRALQE